LCFLVLVPRGEQTAVLGQREQVTQMDLAGVGLAVFPVVDAALADLQQRGQLGLAQSGAHAQGEQLLADSIITRFILTLPAHPALHRSRQLCHEDVQRGVGCGRSHEPAVRQLEPAWNDTQNKPDDSSYDHHTVIMPYRSYSREIFSIIWTTL